MFLNERAQELIKELRDNSNGGVNTHKASICDAMSIVMYMYQMNATEDWEKKALIDAIDTLSNYNQLLTELSTEK